MYQNRATKSIKGHEKVRILIFLISYQSSYSKFECFFSHTEYWVGSGSWFSKAEEVRFRGKIPRILSSAGRCACDNH